MDEEVKKLMKSLKDMKVDRKLMHTLVFSKKSKSGLYSFLSSLNWLIRP